ncbi:MAG: isochorismatase family cysteine hydrolase [Tissierellia bacterium]|nr:isochorismatase family cysteine hydrolase [Tissierellia bacterium]
MEVLVVVDMQNDFIDGALGTAEAQAIVPRVKERIENFDGLVVYTQDTHDYDYLDTEEGKNLPVPHCIKGTHGHEIAPGIYREGAPVFEKVTFGSEKLIHYLKELSAKEKIDRITLLGLCTDICVISNALSLKTYLPEVPIAVDGSCSAGVTPQSHDTALEAMSMCQIQVLQ